MPLDWESFLPEKDIEPTDVIMLLVGLGLLCLTTPIVLGWAWSQTLPEGGPTAQLEWVNYGDRSMLSHMAVVVDEARYMCMGTQRAETGTLVQYDRNLPYRCIEAGSDTSLIWEHPFALGLFCIGFILTVYAIVSFVFLSNRRSSRMG